MLGLFERELHVQLHAYRLGSSMRQGRRAGPAGTHGYSGMQRLLKSSVFSQAEAVFLSLVHV